MRLMFDSQISTQHEENMSKFSEVFAALKEEVDDRKKDIKRSNEESYRKWETQ